MVSPVNWLCSAQKSSKFSIFYAISFPELSVAPVQEIMKLLRFGMPIMMYSSPLSPILLPLMSRHCKKPILLTIILHERGVILLFLISSSRIFLKHPILGISRITSSSLRFLLLSYTILLLRFNLTFLHQYISGYGSHSSGLQISERDRLLAKLRSSEEVDFTTLYTPSNRKGFSVRLSISIRSRKRIASWNKEGSSLEGYSLG